jgi:hypothetical protein
MRKYYFVIEAVQDLVSNKTVMRAWIFNSTLTGETSMVWYSESVNTDWITEQMPAKLEYCTDEHHICCETINAISEAEYNFLREIGVQVMV